MSKIELRQAAGVDDAPYVVCCRFFPGLVIDDQLAEIASLGEEFDRTARKKLADALRSIRSNSSIADRGTPNTQPAFNQGLQVDGDFFGDPRRRDSVSHAQNDLDLLEKPTQLPPLMRPWIRVGRLGRVVRYVRRCSSVLHARWVKPSSLIAGIYLWSEWGELWSPRYYLFQIEGKSKAEWVAQKAARSLLESYGSIMPAFGLLIRSVELALLSEREGTREVDVAEAISARRTNTSVSAVGELVDSCQAEVIRLANQWDEVEPEDGIPRNYRTRPITKKYAADLLGMNASSNPTATLNKAIDKGRYKVISMPGNSWVFDWRIFPDDVHDRVRIVK